MSFIGGGPFDMETCSLCGSLLWNGCCENSDCKYHFHPKDEDELENEE